MGAAGGGAEGEVRGVGEERSFPLQGGGVAPHEGVAPGETRPCTGEIYSTISKGSPFFCKSADFCGFAKICERAELVKNA